MNIIKIRVLILCVLIIVLCVSTASCANKSKNSEFGNNNSLPSDIEITYSDYKAEIISFEDVMGSDYSLMHEEPNFQPEYIGKESVQNSNHPIIYLHRVKLYREDVDIAVVIGGSKDGVWLSPMDLKVTPLNSKKDLDELLLSKPQIEVDTDLIQGDESFVLFSDQYETITQGIEKPRVSVYSEIDKKGLSFRTTSYVPHKDLVIGYHGNWNALPRLPKRIGDGRYELDIDNDGHNEVLTIEFISGNQDITYSRLYVESMGNRALVSEMEILTEYLDTYTLYTLDLNGDERMELIQYAYGFLYWPEIYEMKNGAFQQILVNQ